MLEIITWSLPKDLEEELGGFDESLRKTKEAMSEIVKQILPTEVGLKILSKTSEGKKVFDFVEKAKQKFSIS